MSESEDHIRRESGRNSPMWEEANAWLLRMHSGMMSNQEREEFAAWRRQSAIHESQFRQVEHFWHALDGLAGHVERDRQVPHTTSIRVDQRPIMAVLSTTPLRSRFRWPAIAAAVFLVVLVPLLWPALDIWLSDYRTLAGEQTSISLADGSTVHLNTRSALSVDLSNRRRALSLKTGEALFEVAPDPSRPFEVAVNGGAVRAVGTIFNIDCRGVRTTVSVIEGSVRLLHGGESHDIPAGYRLSYERGASPGPLESIDRRVTAWRQHEFIFNDLPLELIVEQLNRYRAGPIFIMNAQLKATRLSGSVALDDPDRSLTMLQQVLPFQVTHMTPYLALISP